MNKQRRKQLGAVIDALTKPLVAAALQLLLGATNAALEELEALKDEEQEYLDNMPEGMQEGEKGQNAQQAVSDLEESIGAIETLRDALDEFSPEDIASSIDNARGKA